MHSLRTMQRLNKEAEERQRRKLRALLRPLVLRGKIQIMEEEEASANETTTS